eukprot:Platyproteum_vivax@DN5375_c0_g1_i1.p1
MVVHLLVLVFCIMSMGSESKSIIGLSNFKEYDSVGSYCFTIPPGEFGKIHAQTVLHTPNHEFLVLSDTELTSAQFSCNLLHSRSKYVKPLVEHDKQVTAYDLLLNIEPNLNRQKLLAVISRCGGLVDAEYVVEFTNPGGIFKKHFSCLDQGIFEVYLLLAAISICLLPTFFHSWITLERRQATNIITVMFFLAAPLFLIHILLMTVHLFVYSQDGFGLAVFQFLAQLSLATSTTLLTGLLLCLAQGLTISTQEISGPLGNRSMLVVLASGLTHLLYCLQEAMTYSDLSPFAQLHSLISVFHLACRAIAGYLCYLLAWNSLQAENDVSKRQLYISIASVGAGWLAYLPIVAWLLGYQSPQLVCVLILLPHLACLFFLNMYLSPEKFGTLFDQLPATTKYHPYGELK